MLRNARNRMSARTSKYYRLPETQTVYLRIPRAVAEALDEQAQRESVDTGTSVTRVTIIQRILAGHVRDNGRAA
jgi:hypothetical protein